jgi:hypothetical protein
MASTDARPIPKKNTAYRHYFTIFDADGDLVSGAAGLDSEVSIDGGNFVDCTNEATEIQSSGIYYLDLTSGEMNGDAICIIVKTTTSGAKTTPIFLFPQEAGDIKVSVEAMDANAVTATSIASNAITSAKIADGALTAAKIATGAVDADAIAADALAAIKTQVVSALATDTYPEPGQGAPGATISLAAKIGYLYKNWRNAKKQTATQYSLLNDDAVTVDHKASVSDDGSTLTKGEMAAGP